MNILKTLKILVVGDIMLDRYIEGRVEKISPEAPVPVVNVEKEYHFLGGCGNVVRNLVELGVNVSVISKTGYDESAEKIVEELVNLGVAYEFAKHGQTTEKIRVISDCRQIQMIRIDKESIEPLPPAMARGFTLHRKEDYDFVIVSDYAKGMVTQEVMDALKTTNFPEHIIVDPKPCNAHLYDKVFMITPNRKEWREISKTYKPKVEFILETLGRDGLHLFNYDGTYGYKTEGKPVDVYNVSGAGDTVVAVMAVCLSLGMHINDAAQVANKCAQYVVTQPGTSFTPREFFEKIVSKKGVYV